MHYWRTLLLLMSLFCVSSAVLAQEDQSDDSVKRPTLRRSSGTEAVAEGAAKVAERRLITAMEFCGNQQITSEEILSFFKLTKVGNLYSQERLEADLDRVRVLLYAERGFLKAHLDASEVEDGEGGVKIVVAVEEDKLYRYGAIKVEDASVFSPEQIIADLGVKTGEVVKGYTLGQALEKLHAAYRDQGYIVASISSKFDFKPSAADSSEGIADVTFEADEEAQYVISSITFMGVSEREARLLRRKLLIHDGDVYRESLINASLLSMEGLSFVDSLRVEDIEMRWNSRTHQVDLTIHVPRKQSPY